MRGYSILAQLIGIASQRIILISRSVTTAKKGCIAGLSRRASSIWRKELFFRIYELLISHKAGKLVLVVVSSSCGNSSKYNQDSTLVWRLGQGAA